MVLPQAMAWVQYWFRIQPKILLKIQKKLRWHITGITHFLHVWWSPLDNYFFETYCIFTHIVQSYTTPYGYCYSSRCDKIFFHLLPRPLRLTSVSGATPSSSLTSPSSFAGFCTCAVCSCSVQQHLYHRCLYSKTLVSDRLRPRVWVCCLCLTAKLFLEAKNEILFFLDVNVFLKSEALSVSAELFTSEI